MDRLFILKIPQSIEIWDLVYSLTKQQCNLVYMRKFKVNRLLCNLI